MRNFKALVYFFNPNIVFLSSTSNEINSEGDILVMGVNLSREVIGYLSNKRKRVNINK